MAQIRDKEIIVPADLCQLVVNYLQTRPYMEVANLLHSLVAADKDTKDRKEREMLSAAQGPKLLDGKVPDGV